MKSLSLGFTNQSKNFPDLPIQIDEVPLLALETFPTDSHTKTHLSPEIFLRRDSKGKFIPNLYLIRDDLLPFGFGTKWRKALGIIEYLKSNRIKQVLLWGAIHGNYLASFTYIFRCFEIEVETIAYTRDPKLKTYNEQLVRGHSHSIHCYANRKEAYAAWFEKKERYQGLALPEFGIHPGQILGLKEFWENLKKEMEICLKGKPTHKGQEESEPTEKGYGIDTTPPNIRQNPQGIDSILVMEIGSGATFLSALDVFQETSVLVLGVMVGEPKVEWIGKIESIQRQLGLKTIPIPSEQILEIPSQIPGNGQKTDLPIEPKKKSISFGKNHKTITEWIADFYRNTNILLEPVYSGITVYPLLREIYEMRDSAKNNPVENSQINSGKDLYAKQNQFLRRNIPGELVPVFYLHQGGQIQHLDLILDKDSK
ncbi:hypothetical protein [Leptospira brenneri]|uniref:hypothetical protein n=1 Tax=Leptospira brenneri TaxID=2023182 RepID=UPI000C29ACEA|nr:hypothetical protein [Leptospira brenneri]PJZ45210.1 hypothetical protein CH361_09190 [Leptospira brenneri]